MCKQNHTTSKVDIDENPLNNILVPTYTSCIHCGRNPRLNETYGNNEDQWDFRDICPECYKDVISYVGETLIVV